MKIGSLFSGIGGLELGLERAGVGQVVWQCEVDSFCRQVLAKHWPNVERFEDVTQPRTWPAVDLICGGFPCQDVSSAGARRGLSGARSGLWFHFARVVEEVRPSWVVVENVASGKRLWLPTVKAQLESLGYRVRAFSLSAADVGAPHLRRRVFVVAHPGSLELREQPGRSGGTHGEGSLLAADTGEERRAHGDADGYGESARSVDVEVGGVPSVASGASAWATPPEFRGVDDGLPDGLDDDVRRSRLHALGNAVVPQCAETIGRVIVAMQRQSEEQKGER